MERDVINLASETVGTVDLDDAIFGVAVRPDILAHLKNDRAVTLLCSKWGSAPDPSAQNLLTYVTETDADT